MGHIWYCGPAVCLEHPCGIVIDSTGNVFVVDAWNMWIQKFDNNGNFYYKMALINPSINLYNEYQMLSIYAVPISITTATIIALTEKFSSCYISKGSQASKNIHKLANDKIDKKL